MVGIIILIIAASLLVGTGIYVLIWGATPKIPEGFRMDAKLGDYSSIIVIDDSLTFLRDVDTNEVTDVLLEGVKIPIEQLKYCTMVSMIVTNQAFLSRGFKAPEVKKMVLHILPDEQYFSMYPFMVNTGAFVTEASGRIYGSGIPKMVCRAKYAPSIILKGQPVIHEMIHMCLMESMEDYDPEHADQRLWAKFGIESIEKIALQHWSEIITSKVV